LDPASVTVARIGNTIATAVLGLVALVALTVLLFASSLVPVAKLLLTVGLVVVLAGLAGWGLYWPGVRYRYASYRLGDHGIQIRRGVLWRSVTTVPKSRVQHTDVSQGPIDRSFGLATLVIHTAGTQEAVVTLGGLAHPVALAIRDYLIGGGEDDAV
jgi:membrane protein YdbS with pleckstrin-like domain